MGTYYKHLKSVLTPQECDTFIALGQGLGFERAKVNVYGEQQEILAVRNNDRVEWDDPVLAERLSNTLQQALGSDFPAMFRDRHYAGAADHLRMYRYEPGQYFKPHRDGHFRVHEHLETEITVLFYLNTPQGGETILMPYGKAMPDSFIHIAPAVGDVLLFEHHFWHEGRPVLEGEKFVLRTDLFYRD